MKAIIMAGGEGTRLRPITCLTPKPIVPLVDRPVLEYTLMLLKKHGITEVAITLGYLGDRIRETLGDGARLDMQLRYYEEPVPMGTAGGVKMAADFLDDVFLVLSGDGVTDIDLTRALDFHTAHHALATLVLKRVENPLEYGVVSTDADGRIRAFHEKPGWGEVLSDTVNTGIYLLQPQILDKIPGGRPYDFSRELFPALLREQQPLYAWTADGYWCDVGDMSAYLAVHADALDGKIALPLPTCPGGITKSPGARIDKSAVLEGPVYIGENSVIGSGAHVGPYVVMGEGCVIASGASVKKSVLGRGARIGAHARLRGAIVLAGARVADDAAMFEESVLAEQSLLSCHAMLLPGVRVWPRKEVPESVRQENNLVWGARRSFSFDGGFLPFHSPAQAVQAAQGLAAALRPREALVARTPSAVSTAYAHCISAGLMAQGVQVYDAGLAILPQLRSVQARIRANISVLVNEDGIYPLVADGAYLSREKCRAVEALLLRQDAPAPFAAVTRPVIAIGRTDIGYSGALLASLSRFGGTLKPLKIAVYAPGEQLLTLAERVFSRAGLVVRAEWEEEMMELAPDETGIWLSADGQSVRFSCAEGLLSSVENEMLAIWTLIEGGETELLLPAFEAHAGGELATRAGIPVRTIHGDRAHFMETLIAQHPHQFHLRYDALYAALHTLGALGEQQLTLSALRKRLPVFRRVTRTIAIDNRQKGRILRELTEKHADATLEDGISFRSDSGWAWIMSPDDHAECVVVGESHDAETARELCDFYADTLEEMLQRAHHPAQASHEKYGAFSNAHETSLESLRNRAAVIGQPGNRNAYRTAGPDPRETPHR